MKILLSLSSTLQERMPVNLILEIIGDSAEIVVSEDTYEEMLATARDADVVLTFRAPREFIANAPNLKMVQTLGAGVNWVDIPSLIERNIILCNTHDNGVEVAEYAIMLMLSTAKHVVESDRDFRTGNWRYFIGGDLPNIQLSGKTCLIVGFGGIGRAIAERLKGFGMKVNAVNRSGTSEQSDLLDNLYSVDEIHANLGDSDFVILAIPLTQHTFGMVDETFLSLMKPSSILINVSRGHIIDEAALYDVLKTKEIQGAGIDVWWDYPSPLYKSGQFPSQQFPFHELDNVVITPHKAGDSRESIQCNFQTAAENVLRFIRGEDVHNRVNLELGY